ncbi:MAG: glycine cleavage system protein GcvH [Nitrososphaeraceae archaeon]
MSVKEEIRFSKEHEWLIVKEGIATMGISDFAQKQLGDIVSVELPKVGAAFSQMQAMAIIDSVKASSDIYCAISGEVVQVNEQLLEHPELINQSPYESGWIAKIKPSNLQEFEQLMTKEQYNEFVGETNQHKEDNQDKQEKKSNEGQEEHKNRHSQANGPSI